MNQDYQYIKEMIERAANEFHLDCCRLSTELFYNKYQNSGVDFENKYQNLLAWMLEKYTPLVKD